jgi:hypothetical protein
MTINCTLLVVGVDSMAAVRSGPAINGTDFDDVRKIGRAVAVACCKDITSEKLIDLNNSILPLATVGVERIA